MANKLINITFIMFSINKQRRRQLDLTITIDVKGVMKSVHINVCNAAILKVFSKWSSGKKESVQPIQNTQIHAWKNNSVQECAYTSK